MPSKNRLSMGRLNTIAECANRIRRDHAVMPLSCKFGDLPLSGLEPHFLYLVILTERAAT